MRQYAIRSDRELSDPAARKILWSPLWPKLRTLLEKHGRLDIVDKPASGPKSDSSSTVWKLNNIGNNELIGTRKTLALRCGDGHGSNEEISRPQAAVSVTTSS